MIKQLSQQTAEQLCAQQVITSLPDCVKQLIDNAIDAKATYVKVVLQQYGKAKIEVIDNGMGIDSFDFLGKKGTTSKNKLNQRFDYLGFRGEAVHSIARVSGDMEIESKCAKDGHRRKFNLVTSAYFQSKEERLCHGQFNFQLPNREGSRNTGTKVTIGNIFQRLPVRQIELSCKCREFLRKTNDLIKEYCLIYPEIQFMLINSREGREEVIIQTAAQKRFDRGGWLERIRELDERIAQSLLYVCGAEYEGYVLDKIESGSSKENRFLKKNYHYLFLNRRPIDPVPPILTAFNDIYRKYNHSTKYAFIINLKLDHQEIDVNLTPNKREVFIRKNVLDRIVQALRQEIVSKVVEEITTLSSPQDGKKTAKSEPAVLAEISKVHPLNPRKTIFLPTQAPEEPKNRSQVSKSEKTHEGKPGLQFQNYPKAQGSHSQQLNKPAKNGIDMSELPKISVDRNKLKLQLNSKLSASFLGLRRTSENPFTLGSGLERSSLREVEEPQIRRKTPQEKLREEQQDAKRRADFMQEMKQVKIEQNEQELNKIKISTASKRTFPQKGSLMEQEVRRRESAEAESEHEVSAETNQHERGRSSWIATMPRGNHDVELQNRIKSKLNVDMSQIFTKFNQARQPTPNPTEQERTDTLKEDGHYHTANAGTLKADAQRVEQMQGTGEIQQGQQQIKEVHFDSKGKDEESINQELCAELGELAPKSVKKHHFQHFQVIGQFNKGFIITAFNRKFYMVDQHASDQKYHYQKNLQKSSDLECINCFDQKEITPIDCDEIEQAKHFLQQVGFSYCIEGRKLLKLLRCPLFKGRKLGLEYFDLIVAEKKELAKVSKFAAMCAMSACREATKVGEVLGRQDMRASVLKLSGLASPWNCPHGRPTLIDLGAVEKLKNGIRLEKEYLI